MVIDVIVSVLLVFALLRGWARGFLFQIGQAAWAVAAFLLAKWLGKLLEPTVIDIGASQQTAGTISFVVVFLALYIAGSYLIWRTTREIHEASQALTTSDRALGLLVGGIKGVVLIYVAFVILIMTHRLTGKVPVPYASSYVGRWVVQHNFLDSEDFPRAKALAQLGTIIAKQSPLALAKNPHFQAILAHPKAAVLAEPEVQRALLDQDWMALVSHEGIWDLLDEPEIQKHLNAIEAEGEPKRARTPKRSERVPKVYTPADAAP